MLLCVMLGSVPFMLHARRMNTKCEKTEVPLRNIILDKAMDIFPEPVSYASTKLHLNPRIYRIYRLDAVILS